MVSLHSPIDGRLWLSVELHPGNTVSCTQVEVMVAAAEQRTCVRPQHRTELLAQRLLAVSEQRCKAEARLEQRQGALTTAQVERSPTNRSATITPTTGASPTVRWRRAQAKVVTKPRRVSRQCELVTTVRSLEQTLQRRLQRFTDENAANGAPVQAIFRLDAGFGTGENIAVLDESGQ